MVRLLAIIIFVFPLLFGCGSSDHDGVAIETPHEVSDNTILNLVKDLKKVPVISPVVFTNRVKAIYYSIGYEVAIEGMLEANEGNIRHREEILKLIFSKTASPQFTSEVVMALEVEVQRIPVLDLEKIGIDEPSADYPFYFYQYIRDLSQANNKHRMSFIEQLRCLDVNLQSE